jgi:hypothetical protein
MSSAPGEPSGDEGGVETQGPLLAAEVGQPRLERALQVLGRADAPVEITGVDVVELLEGGVDDDVPGRDAARCREVAGGPRGRVVHVARRGVDRTVACHEDWSSAPPAEVDFCAGALLFAVLFFAVVFDAVLLLAGELFAAVDFFAGELFCAGELFAAVDFFAGELFLAVDVFAVDFVAVLLFAGEPVDAVLFFAVDFFAVDFFAVDFFAVDVFAVDFFAVDFLAVLLFAGELLLAVGLSVAVSCVVGVRATLAARPGPDSPVV